MHVDREWGLTDLNIDVALEGLKVTRSWKFPQGKRHTWLSAEKHNPDDNVYGDVSEIFCGYSRISAIVVIISHEQHQQRQELHQ